MFETSSYQDEEQDIIDQQTINNVAPVLDERHLLITGWSAKTIDWESLEKSFKVTCQNPTGSEILKNKDDFYCLDFSLDGEFVNKQKKIIDFLDILENILKGCLKHFGNYINVALAYKVEENDEIHYYYQTRLTGNNLKHLIDSLKIKIAFLRSKKQVVKYNSVSRDIIDRYIMPGIEQVSEKSIGPTVLNYLRNRIKKTNLFFDLPYSIISNTFHLYHHPERSFPLPILLKDPIDMPKYKDLWDYENWDWGFLKKEDLINEISRKKFKVLGYYSHGKNCESKSIGQCIGPHIVLCPERIENCKDLTEQVLYLKVLIHELAHAMMDKSQIALNSLFSRAMEESLANMITLQWFDAFNKSNYNKVKSFMESQLIFYEFGINQFEAGVDWTKWRDSKKKHKLLKEWFNFCFDPNTEEGPLSDPLQVRAEYNCVLKKTNKKK